MNIYPWQLPLWKRLTEVRQGIPHALLLQGRSGIGKLDLAKNLSQSLLCQTPDASGMACGVCASCGWFMQSNHPDYRLLTPVEEGDATEDEPAAIKKSGKKNQISIDQVRELASFMGLSSHHSSGPRIVLIHPAEALNPSSANALLKMLEEPPVGMMFILVSHQPQRLLPTIRSRCQKIDMPVPTHEVAMAWLNLQGIIDADERLTYAGGAPLGLLQDSDINYTQLTELWQMLSKGIRLDPYAATPICTKVGMEVAVPVLQKWAYDLLACAIQFSERAEVRYHPKLKVALQGLAKDVNVRLLLDFQRKLDEARRAANHPLNIELQLECLLLQYTQIFFR